MVAVVVALVGWWFAQHGGSAADSHDTGQPGSSYSSGGAGSGGSAGQSGTVRLSDLPPEAAETVRLIDAGGPFPYPDHDDKTFGNYEGVLPQEPYGFYKEYTVPTPGSDDRGARRIIKGADGTLWWTADHYELFAQIQR